MLCFRHSEQGDICTNRCHEWADCSHRKSPSYMKVPFLVESVDVLVSEIEPQIIDGIYVITYRPSGFSPQSTEHGFLEEFSPARIPGTEEKKITFYTKNWRQT